jgi:hypothetical protein
MFLGLIRAAKEFARPCKAESSGAADAKPDSVRQSVGD